MTREELIKSMQAIANLLTAEIDRPGENEDRYRALKQAEALALEALKKAEAP